MKREPELEPRRGRVRFSGLHDDRNPSNLSTLSLSLCFSFFCAILVVENEPSRQRDREFCQATSLRSATGATRVWRAGRCETHAVGCCRPCLWLRRVARTGDPTQRSALALCSLLFICVWVFCQEARGQPPCPKKPSNRHPLPIDWSGVLRACPTWVVVAAAGCWLPGGAAALSLLRVGSGGLPLCVLVGSRLR